MPEQHQTMAACGWYIGKAALWPEPWRTLSKQKTGKQQVEEAIAVIAKGWGNVTISPRVVHLFANGSSKQTLCASPTGHSAKVVYTWENTPRERRCPHCLDALHIEAKRINALIEMCSENKPKTDRPANPHPRERKAKASS